MEKDKEIAKTKIDVRSLSGESICVVIERNKTIQQLKQQLKHAFPPASTSPNFHLFLKGTKLSLQSQISSFSMCSGEFLVLVPFAKKDGKSEKSNETWVPCTTPNKSLESELAQSAYSDLVQDLSSLKNSSSQQCRSQAEVEVKDMNDQSCRASEACSLPSKRKKTSTADKSQDPVVDFLQSSHADTAEERNWKTFLQILDSVNCLSDPVTSNCMLNGAISEDPCSSRINVCICPSWLKRTLKAFTFLNIYSAFCQMWLMKLTLTTLSNVLDQLSKFGIEVAIADIEQLAVVCPKIVKIVEDEREVGERDSILILDDSCLEKNDQDGPLSRKRAPLSKVRNAIKKRGDSFIDILSASVKALQCKNGGDMLELFSLDYLLTFVKEGVPTKHAEKKSRINNYQTSSSNSFELRCRDTHPLLPEEMVEHLKHGLGSHEQVVHVEEIQARHPKYVEIPSELSETTTLALARIGITRLYCHQAKSIQASLAGKHVVVATMTSSGKSLCYNVPVLELLSRNLLACALYLFPTKALAQDQLRTLMAMTEGFDESLKVGIYDGDTPQVDRLWQRDNARMLITNPDMLHVSILPYHRQFSRILSNLRFVILDEAHTYKGSFGCHTALIIRRLRRICSHVYGADPSFVFSTATSANPREHAMELANLQEVELVDNDGSPSPRKLFLLWNPPLCMRSAQKGKIADKMPSSSGHKDLITKRSSSIIEMSLLFAEMVKHGLRCIAFCKSRKLCELVLFYTREVLQEVAPDLVDSICGYRGGYIAEDRRQIESNFFNGRVSGIAATNALELGIDVGHIDVTLHLGFPGSIASLWQQAGRSGRREKQSLAVYVAFDGPLDQYFMKFPQKLFDSPIECCHIDANNKQVLEQHLQCASVEHPLSLTFDESYFGPGLESSVLTLKSNGLLTTDPSRPCSARIWSYIGHEKAPSKAISIRAIETERYKVMDIQKNEVLEEIEESRAFFQVYDGAVYMNQGKTYLVKDLDSSSKVAWCQRADLKYYTKTRDYTDIHVIGGKIAYVSRIHSSTLPRTTAQASPCKVTTTWFGFRRIWRGSNQVFDTVELSLPDYSYQSQAVWIRVQESVKLAVEAANYSFRGGLHAAGHALLNVVPLYIVCNPSDLASECVNPHDSRYVPERILLYDPRPGGTGISVQIQPIFTKLLTAALELLSSCPCFGEAGCPNCVQNLTCGEYNEVLHKDSAIMIIKAVLEAEKSSASEVVPC